MGPAPNALSVVPLNALLHPNSKLPYTSIPLLTNDLNQTPSVLFQLIQNSGIFFPRDTISRTDIDHGYADRDWYGLTT